MGRKNRGEAGKRESLSCLLTGRMPRRKRKPCPDSLPGFNTMNTPPSFALDGFVYSVKAISLAGCWRLVNANKGQMKGQSCSQYGRCEAVDIPALVFYKRGWTRKLLMPVMALTHASETRLRHAILSCCKLGPCYRKETSLHNQNCKPEFSTRSLQYPPKEDSHEARRPKRICRPLRHKYSTGVGRSQLSCRATSAGSGSLPGSYGYFVSISSAILFCIAIRPAPHRPSSGFSISSISAVGTE